MSVRARLASLPLRVRLVLVVVLLTAAGLAVAGVATRYALERFLVDRLDQQITSAEQPLVLALAGGGPGGPSRPGRPAARGQLRHRASVHRRVRVRGTRTGRRPTS